MYCHQCGTQNQDGAARCFSCGTNLQLPRQPAVAPVAPAPEMPVATATAPPQWAQSPYVQGYEQAQVAPYAQGLYAPQPGGNDAFSTLVPYKNSSALISYYLAVFSLIPCAGLFLGIAAFVLGLQGLRFAKAHPEAKGQAHAWVGIILGGLCGFGSILVILWLVGMNLSNR